MRVETVFIQPPPALPDTNLTSDWSDILQEDVSGLKLSY